MIVDKVSQLVDNGELATALQIIDNHIQDPDTDCKYELILKKIHILETKGLPEEALALLTNELHNVKEGSDLKFHYLLTKANIISKLNQRTEAKDLLDSLKDQFDFDTVDPIMIAKYYTMQSIMLFKLGEYTSSANIALEGLQFCDEYNLEFRKISLWVNLANIYVFQGRFDEAIQYFMKGLEYFNHNKPNLTYQAVLNLNLGKSHYFRGSLEKSIKFLHEAKDLALKSSLVGTAMEAVFYNILSRKNLSNSFPNELHCEFIRISSTDSLRNRILIQYLDGLKSKYGERMTDLVKAQRKFKRIVDGKIVDYQIHFMAMLSFVELLLDEMEKFGVKEVIIKELHEVLHKLISHARLENVVTILCPALLLAGKVSLLEKTPDISRKQFKEALAIAEKYDMRNLERKARKFYDESLSIMTKLQFNPKSMTTEDIFDYIDTKSSVRSLQDLSIDNSPETDDPLAFLIINPGMALLHSLKLRPKFDLDDRLLGNLLTALSSLGAEIFDVGSRINKIEIGAHTILFAPYNEYIFSYTFQGSTISATIKLEKFIRLFERDDLESVFFKTKFSVDNREVLEDIIKSNFL